MSVRCVRIHGPPGVGCQSRAMSRCLFSSAGPSPISCACAQSRVSSHGESSHTHGVPFSHDNQRRIRHHRATIGQWRRRPRGVTTRSRGRTQLGRHSAIGRRRRRKRDPLNAGTFHSCAIRSTNQLWGLDDCHMCSRVRVGNVWLHAHRTLVYHRRSRVDRHVSAVRGVSHPPTNSRHCTRSARRLVSPQLAVSARLCCVEVFLHVCYLYRGLPIRRLESPNFAQCFLGDE